MKIFVRLFGLGFFALFAMINSVSATAVPRSARGANAAAIQSVVNQFRADLGGANNGVGGSFTTGRREINWDGVPDAFAQPNFLPVDFFNVNSPHGVVFSTPRTDQRFGFMVSANAGSGTAVRFGNINASYPAIFQTFSAERLFHIDLIGIDNPPFMSVHFFIPGTNIPATVSGFGMIFCDVDFVGSAAFRVYGVDGRFLHQAIALPFNNGLSFEGVSFNAGERIARVEITFGTKTLASSNNDGSSVDVMALDDFIYGEPRASQFHENDFDGDGFADASVFRPSAGTFFVLNSGSNTFNVIPFGQNGDVPVSGDFDGDQRADVAIYRPSLGQWWYQRSSDGQVFAVAFGTSTDKPTPGDFDKDGKTDIAFWRPSSGNYFVLRSSNNTFFSFPWGQNGDLPVGAAIVP